jgi:hypothetical protein
MFNIIGLSVKMMLFIITIIVILNGGYRIISSIIRDFREKNTRKAAIKIAAVLAIVFGGRALGYSLGSGKLPVQVNESAKQYIMNINEVKQSNSGTKIKINEVLLDLNNINFNLSVKGRDKLVAVEIKEDLKKTEVLRAINGLWVGKFFNYEPMSFGAGYSSDTFLESVYLVCHLSNGEEISFEVEDRKNVGEKVKLIKLDNIIDDNGKKIRFKEFGRGVNYSSLELVSDIDLFSLEVSMLADGKEYDKFPSSGGGGRLSYSMPPVGEEEVIVKIKVKASGKEYQVKIQ